MDAELIGQVLGIIIIDLVLSGDNAVVIGMAARSLPPPQRRKAIIFGGGAAVGLRILFTALATLLLQVPLLQAAGGLLLIWIAIKLLTGGEHSEEGVQEAGSMAEAIRIIVLADVVMSLDNMLAVAATAHGDLWLLLFGLAVSIPLLLLGSSLVSSLLNRFPWLTWVGALILGWAAARMIVEDQIVEDKIVHPYLEAIPSPEAVVTAVIVALVVGVTLLVNRRRQARLAQTGRAEESTQVRT